jgi:hypothetical protein
MPVKHDPKTGRFMSGTGGGSGKASAKSSKRAANKKALDSLPRKAFNSGKARASVNVGGKKVTYDQSTRRWSVGVKSTKNKSRALDMLD